MRKKESVRSWTKERGERERQNDRMIEGQIEQEKKKEKEGKSEKVGTRKKEI